MKNFRKWLVYGIVPAIVMLLIIGMYFSHNTVLQRIVCPKLPPLPVDSWREFGLLELLQNVCLVIMAATLAYGVFKLRSLRERAACALLCLFTLFVLGEEIDYGTHIYRFVTTERSTGWFTPVTQWAPGVLENTVWDAPNVNIHNRGNLTDVFKHVADVILFGLFIIFALAGPRIPRPWLKRLAPDRFAILTVLLMVVLNQITHGLGEYEEHVIENAVRLGQTIPWEVGSITNNLSEFRELIVYYLFMVYVISVVRRHVKAIPLPQA
ncbi:MAG TPA: hypothetical protein PLI09_10575 [Candidatus Hydrogenedentes bacterium]|nr:hypothetical protein [Candidatus Hydrogenedentota bacterium]